MTISSKTQAGSIVLAKVPTKTHGNTIMRVATQFHYVHQAERILDLGTAFTKDQNLMCVGVVDDQSRVVGLVTRVQLQNLLSKPFGREILSKKLVQEAMIDAPQFYYGQNLFKVSESLRQEVLKERISYFLLVDADQGFEGIFSSKDLMVYLSSITQVDIELAAVLQNRLLAPQDFKPGEGFRMMSYSKAQKGVGGDFIYHRTLDKNRQFVALCDVSGKGVAASMVTTLLWGIMETYDFTRGLKAFLRDLNQAVIKAFHLEKYLTGLFLVYNPKTQQVKIADMGHSLAFLLRSDKAHRLKCPAKNLPIGISQDLEPKIFRLTLGQGEGLFALTDGFIEQENFLGQTYPLERLLAVFHRAVREGNSPAEATEADFRAFKEGVPQQDDISWLYFQGEGQVHEDPSVLRLH
jgi:sigma-B regulation protein RsbU (phosphoserine phosphatase)